MRFLTLPILLSMLVSCAAYNLHVRLNGKPTQSMKARIEKVNGIWTVDLLIPGGAWAVSSSESGINPHILKIDGQQHVRFDLPPNRMLSSKPVELTLQGLNLEGKPAGDPFIVVIDHYNQYQRASPLS